MLPLLLADRSPCLRWLVLTELLGRAEDDPEVQELGALRERDPLVAPLLAAQGADGSWRRGDLAWRGDAQRMTMLALMRLGYLGFGPETSAVARGAAYLFSFQREDGAWDLPRSHEGTEENEGYSMMPLQTALPLRALAMCGYATDPRAERAYAWLLAQRLEDGAWPTGIAAGGTRGYVAGYRKCPTRDGAVVPTLRVRCWLWLITLNDVQDQKRDAGWTSCWGARRAKRARSASRSHA